MTVQKFQQYSHAIDAPRVKTGDGKSAFPISHNALAPWLRYKRSPQDQEPLHSVQLANRGRWPVALIGYSASLRQTAPRGTSSLRQNERWGEWGRLYHKTIHQAWIGVPLWASVGPPRQVEARNRNAFRKPNPAMKSQALATALQNSAKAIRAARSGG